VIEIVVIKTSTCRIGYSQKKTDGRSRNKHAVGKIEGKTLTAVKRPEDTPVSNPPRTAGGGTPKKKDTICSQSSTVFELELRAYREKEKQGVKSLETIPPFDSNIERGGYIVSQGGPRCGRERSTPTASITGSNGHGGSETKIWLETGRKNPTHRKKKKKKKKEHSASLAN